MGAILCLAGLVVGWFGLHFAERNESKGPAVFVVAAVIAIALFAASLHFEPWGIQWVS